MPENNKIIDLVNPNNIGKIRFLSEGNTYIPWLVNKDNTKVLVFKYDTNKKPGTKFDIEYKILDIAPNENIDILNNIDKYIINESNSEEKYQTFEFHDALTNKSHGRIYMQAINDYFSGSNFDYQSIFNSIYYNFADCKSKNNLITILHKENFWHIENDIVSKVDISSSEAREIVVNIFKKPILQVEKKLESVSTQENEFLFKETKDTVIIYNDEKFIKPVKEIKNTNSINELPKVSTIEKLKNFFRRKFPFSSLFQKKGVSKIDENSISNNNQSESSNLGRRNTTKDVDKKNQQKSETAYRDSINPTDNSKPKTMSK